MSPQNVGLFSFFMVKTMDGCNFFFFFFPLTKVQDLVIYWQESGEIIITCLVVFLEVYFPINISFFFPFFLILFSFYVRSTRAKKKLIIIIKDQWTRLSIWYMGALSRARD